MVPDLIGGLQGDHAPSKKSHLALSHLFSGGSGGSRIPGFFPVLREVEATLATLACSFLVKWAVAVNVLLDACSYFIFSGFHPSLSFAFGLRQDHGGVGGVSGGRRFPSADQPLEG